MICEEWKKRDKRIRVIHKQNEGLALARKTGVENATAEFITFVDADDWIHAEMYADMMAALISTGSDIAQCGVCLVFDDGSMVLRDGESKTNSFEVVGKTEGALLILEDKKWRSWMWCKIFKKHLFNNIQFLKGNNFAEDYIAHHLFHKASQSVYLHRACYYYYQRNDSITKSKSLKAEMKNHLDYADAHYDRYLFIEQHPEYHSILPAHKSFTIYIIIRLLQNIIAFPGYFPKKTFRIKAKQLISISLSKKDIVPLRWRFYRLILKISRNGFKIIWWMLIRFIIFSNKITRSNKKHYWLLSEMIGV